MGFKTDLHRNRFGSRKSSWVIESYGLLELRLYSQEALLMYIGSEASTQINTEAERYQQIRHRALSLAWLKGGGWFPWFWGALGRFYTLLEHSGISPAAFPPLSTALSYSQWCSTSRGVALMWLLAARAVPDLLMDMLQSVGGRRFGEA
jgi:hypothetical protein